MVSFEDWGWGDMGLWMKGWEFGFENLSGGFGARSAVEKIGKF